MKLVRLKIKLPHLMSLLLFLLAGCVSPRVVTDRQDAARRTLVENVYEPGNAVLVQLPERATAAGSKDFYRLSARLTPEAEALYRINIVTFGKVDPQDVKVAVDGIGQIRVETAEKIPLFFGSFVEASFGREVLLQGVEKGAKIYILSRGKLTHFEVPDWMFATLQERADAHDEYRDRALYLESHKGLEAGYREAVASRQIMLGMPSETVRASRGKPDQINRSVDETGIHEQWFYDNTCLFFENGLLESWQESE